jgi:hypothetical protein
MPMIATLNVQFSRCLNIPARYCTGYMSDIGLPPLYAPMDFAARIEVYLGGRWRTLTATTSLGSGVFSSRTLAMPPMCSDPHLRSRHLVDLSRLGRTSVLELTLPGAY